MKVNFGSKYEFKPDQNPGAGTYDPDPAQKHTKPRTYEAFIRPRDPQDYLAAPGDSGPPPYDADKSTFGDLKSKIDMGSKYKFSVNDVPPPGTYNPDPADSITKPRSRTALIQTEVSPGRRPAEALPDPG